MPREEELKKAREQKLKLLRDEGINPYPSFSKRTHKILEVLEKFSSFKSRKVSITGRITGIRSHGKIGFVDVRDESGKIQTYFSKSILKKQFEVFSKKIDLGDFIEVSGKPFLTKKG